MEIFFELAGILLITTLISMFVSLLRQPLVVGYILSGIIVGPNFFNILQSQDSIEALSKVGISILLFIVGLSLNPETIKETGKASLVTGLGQILFTSAIGYIIFLLLGFSFLPSIYGAIALTFSSTIIILKLLSDRGDLGKLYGKLSIGFLLVQDIVATLLLVLVPLLGAYVSTGGEIGVTFINLFLKGAGAVTILYIFGKKALPKISDHLAKSQELLFLFSITWGLVLAGFFHYIGFSIEIGALIAGVSLSASNYAFEISSRMRPLRDFFIILFFVLLGSHIVIGDISSMLIPALILSIFVLVGNPFIVFVLFNLLGYKRRVAFMGGLPVAQISEFSLILMSLGLSLQHIDRSMVSLITLVGIITISGSTYLILYADSIYEYVKPALKKIELRKVAKNSEQTSEVVSEMIIFGYGRVGYEFVKVAQKLNEQYIVVDYNPDTIKHLRGENVNFIFGDAEDVEFLDEIKIDKAKVIVSTIPDPNINLLLIRHYRRFNQDGHIIVSSHSVSETEALYAEGATYVIMSKHLGATHASEMILHFKEDINIFEKARNKQLSDISKYLKH